MPLVPLVTLEPLLRHIRDNQNIKGLTVSSSTHKIAAYAIDLLFILTSQEATIPHLLQELQRYSYLANYKINLDKSEALNINVPGSELSKLQEYFPFKWAKGKLKYLGMFLTPHVTLAFKENYITLLTKIMTDLWNWNGRMHTWFYRNQILKINVLPRLLYIPDFAGSSIFPTLHPVHFHMLSVGTQDSETGESSSCSL